VPFVEKARVPALATLLIGAGLATLAAFGVDGLREFRDGVNLEQSPWLRRINLGVASFAALLGGGTLLVVLSKQLHWDFDDRIGMTFLCAMLLAVLLYAWRSGNLSSRQAVTLLTMLLLLEVGQLAGFMLSDRNDWGRRNFVEKVWGNQDIADFLHSRPGPFRVETLTDDITGNWGDYNNVDFVKAQAGVTVNAFNLEWHTQPTQRLLGVKYILARAPAAADQKEVFHAASNIVVYENPAPFPRAWTVHEAIQVHSDNDVRGVISEHVDDLRTKTLMTGSPPKLACPGATDQVNITKYLSSRVSINVAMSCEGMLVLSDNYYPGWEARVDGRPVEIHEVDAALRGVVVPQGAHEVTFRFRPRTFFLGLALTLTGWLCAAAAAIFSRKKGRLAENHA
jgi:Bacterial membrane protein YfhO